MKKKGRFTFPILLIALSIFTSFCDSKSSSSKNKQEQNNNIQVIEKTNPANYHMTISANSTNTGLTLDWLSVLLPYPQSNSYQEISNINVNGAEKIDIENSDDKYLRFLYTGNSVPVSNETKTNAVSFDLTVYDINTDFSKITKVYDYDKSSELYKHYTSQNDPYIMINYPALVSSQTELWNESGKNYLEYARKAYSYVANNFSYKNANTGLHPLSELVAQNGGDCGNLSTIYISMLRSQGIPARHIIGVRPDGSFHVYSEFYLEKYGWIPVDVTYKNSNPAGDYFGIVKADSQIAILNHEINFSSSPKNDMTEKLVLLQTYAYWYFYKSGTGEININYSIKGTKY